jgi:hypothetical protein
MVAAFSALDHPQEGNVADRALARGRRLEQEPQEWDELHQVTFRSPVAALRGCPG